MVDLNHQIPISAAPAKVYAAIATTDGNRGCGQLTLESTRGSAGTPSSVSIIAAWCFT